MKQAQDNQASRNDDEAETQGEFPEIDHFGLYTIGIYVILGLPLTLSAARSLSYVFTAGKVSYRCLVPECENPANTTLYPVWLSNAVPYTDDDEPEICTRFIVQNSTDSCSTTTFTNETVFCDSWVYDSEESTILNEWDLTCNNNLWKLSLPGTINNVGQFVGLMIFGRISDKYGRRKLILVCTTISAILGLIRSVSVNYGMFVAFEFLDTMVGSAVFSAVFVLGMEFVGPKKRQQACAVTNCMFVTAMIFLGLFARWLKSWRLLLRVIYMPGLLAIFMFCLVPESVRWLQSKGRLEEAEEVLRKIASRNNMTVSGKSILEIRNSNRKTVDQNSKTNANGISAVKEVIGSRIILFRLVTCALCWVAAAFVYYGLSLRSVTVPGDKYINFVLVSAAESPAYLASWFLANNLGRKWTLGISFMLSGIFCIVTIIIPTDWSYVPLILFVSGKLCISIAFITIYMYTTEIFPTPFRNSLLSLCSMIGRIGSMLAPQTPLLANYIPWLPQVLFGVIAISAGLLTLNFPETFRVRLPNTVSEAENIGKLKKKDLCLELTEQT